MKTRPRYMIRSDLPAVLEIETASFADPWDEGDFLRALRQRNAVGDVAEADDGRVVGYALRTSHRGHYRLANFAVAPDARRQGVGRAVVEKIAARMDPHRRAAVVLDVAELNVAAQRFFAACGFRATRVLRRHFSDGRDAYRMERWHPLAVRDESLLEAVEA